MELPQPRPPGTQGGKATHDSLSLYSLLTTHAQQDPMPSQVGYLKTHDFLQPLERVFNNANATKDENKAVRSGVETSVEHLLPGGVGTYSISYFNQRVLKPEGSLFTAQTTDTSRNDGNSNCSSHGFTLWNESAVNMGKTGKENIAAQTHILREAGVNVVEGQCTSLLKKPSRSSNHKHTMTTFSSFSSSQPPSSQKNQLFMEMIAAAKDEEDDEEDDFVIKSEHSSHPIGNLPVNVEAKIIDQKPNTPRSKHSATEQRRRGKINDRFQKLREIIPNSDQKRDKASFLLEVIGYIQLLQEKLNRCECSYNVWNHEPSKTIKWNIKQKAEGFLDHTQGANTDFGRATVFARTFDENRAGVSRGLLINGQNLVDSDISIATTIKQRSQQPELTHYGRTSIAAAASLVSPERQPSDTEKTMSWLPSMKDQELTVESGTIDISSIYSQGFLNALTQALQTSGVDLSQASISVQMDLRKRANCVQRASTLPTKDDDVPASLPHSRAASAGKEFGHALKRLRTS